MEIEHKAVDVEALKKEIGDLLGDEWGGNILTRNQMAINFAVDLIAQRGLLGQPDAATELARLKAELPPLVEALKFYADPGNFMTMNGRWYEYGDHNVDLTQYNPIGTKAANTIARLAPMIKG